MARIASITYGLAGTGKTHKLIQDIKEMLESDRPYSMVIIAPTHKACDIIRRRLSRTCVLRWKVGKPSMVPMSELVDVKTVHSLLYMPDKDQAWEDWRGYDLEQKLDLMKKYDIGPEDVAARRWRELRAARRKDAGGPLTKEQEEKATILTDRWDWKCVARLTRDLKFVSKEGSVEEEHVLVDEASMVSPKMIDDLLLAMGPGGMVHLYGDHGQLPPVNEAAALPAEIEAAKRDPDGAGLCELKKQWRTESPELNEISKNARRTGNLPLKPRSSDYYEIFRDGNVEVAASADMVLTYRNLVRKKWIAAIREHKGFSGPPQDGEPLMIQDPPQSLIQDWPKSTVVHVRGKVHLMDSSRASKGGTAEEYGSGYLMTVEREDGKRMQMVAASDGFKRETLTPGDVAVATVTWKLSKPLEPEDKTDREAVERFDEDMRAYLKVREELEEYDVLSPHGTFSKDRPWVLDFAYARTVHNSQGDEAPHVVYIQSAGYLWYNDRELLKKLVYTAASRAREKLTFIKAQTPGPEPEPEEVNKDLMRILGVGE